jgi:primary-amine oxidase
MSTRHPLDPLDADEIRAAAAIYRSTIDGDENLFSTITLEEPTRADLIAHRDGSSVERCARVIAVAGPCALRHAVISLDRKELLWQKVFEEARPMLLFHEILEAAGTVKNDPRWQAAMRERGIDDLELVQLDPWPPGTFGFDHEAGRRLTRVISYLRETPDDNGYARPIEGVIVDVDLGTGEIVHFEDHGVVPLPPERGSYYPEDVGPARTDLAPIQITQPDGPSFEVDGNLVRWQRWQVRVSLNQLEGLVLHDVAYDDPAAGRVRPILHRAALSEMVVPYGSTSPAQRWKNAFDAGEWGLGRFVNALELGCDCLGEIHYFDAVRSTEQGDADLVSNAICMHEEDYSILWKHQDLHSFRTEVRRQRRLVISAIYTVGNYEYGFYWYFYLDGSIQLEVKLTGIVQTQAVAPGTDPGNANLIAPGLAAPHHQHLFCVRLDPSVDGPDNRLVEVDVEPMEPGDDNEWANGFRSVSRVLDRERAARRDVDSARSRTWRITNPSSTNRLGQPVQYKLVPGATPTMLAHPDSAVGRRAAFARHNLWVTPYDPEQRRAAGEHPSQSSGDDGLGVWTEQDRPVDDTEIVVWHTFGVTHLVRPEDWPVMPVEPTGFWLIPVGFFDRNPALDVPPPASHCGSP